MEKQAKKTAATIDEYIGGFPAEVQQKLQNVRLAVQKAAPQAVEAIKYAIPTFVLHGNLVSFAAWKKHIGFYPAPWQVEAFKEGLSAFKGEKGTVKFPLDEPMPIELIGRIVKYQLARNEEKALAKKKK